MLIHVIKITTGPLTRTTAFRLQRLRCTVRQYANEPHPRKPVNSGGAYTIGTFTSIFLGTIAYAKYDDEFREWLAENVPPMDNFIRFAFQERKSYGEQYDDLVRSFKRWFSSNREDSDKKAIKHDIKQYKSPRPAFSSLKDNEEPPPYNEIRVQSRPDRIDIVTEKPVKVSNENSPQNIVELEEKIGGSVEHVVSAYGKAAAAFKEYNQEVEKIVEDSLDKLSPKMWTTLKEKTEQKNAILKEAECTAYCTLQDLDKFRCLIDDPSFKASPVSKATAKRNIDRVMADIRAAKEEYERHKQLCNITDKYWHLVFDARCHFIQELEILFPNFDINKKKLSLKPSDLDLFVAHAFKHVLYYQKELQKLEVLVQMKLRQAVEAARRKNPQFDIKEVMIRQEIEQLADDSSARS